LQAAVNVFGSDVVAAYTAASKVSVLSMQLPISLGVAMSTYCGQNYGAGDYNRIFAGVRAAFMLNFAIAALDAMLCIFGGPFAVRLFIENPSVQIMDYAMEYLWITSWFFVPLGWIFIYRNSLQGLGKGFTPMLSSMLEFIARYLTIKLFGASFGYTAICFADPATWVSTALMLLLPYSKWASDRKKEMAQAAKFGKSP
jgi:Na+-driven multidrug efflux pump